MALSRTFRWVDFGPGAVIETGRTSGSGPRESKITTDTDSPIALQQMGARVYDPTTGRFLQTDPIPGGSANAYDYCNQDPINCTDLNGQWPHWGQIWRAVKRAVVRAYRHIQISYSACIYVCVGLGFQHGHIFEENTAWGVAGAGLASPGASISYTHRPWARQSSTVITAGGGFVVGGQGTVGVRNGHVDWGDWSAGVQIRAYGGYAGVWHIHDLWDL